MEMKDDAKSTTKEFLERFVLVLFTFLIINENSIDWHDWLCACIGCLIFEACLRLVNKMLSFGSHGTLENMVERVIEGIMTGGSFPN